MSDHHNKNCKYESILKEHKTLEKIYKGHWETNSHTPAESVAIVWRREGRGRIAGCAGISRPSLL